LALRDGTFFHFNQHRRGLGIPAKWVEDVFVKWIWTKAGNSPASALMGTTMAVFKPPCVHHDEEKKRERQPQQQH
jgi:hypothetical protein